MPEQRGGVRDSMENWRWTLKLLKLEIEAQAVNCGSILRVEPLAKDMMEQQSWQVVI